MTLSDEDKRKLFDRLNASIAHKMEHVFELAMGGEVTWDHELWSALMDYFESPLRKMLYQGSIERGESVEKNPAYKAYELFDRLRLQGLIDDGPIISTFLAFIKELGDFQSEALMRLNVKFKTEKELTPEEMEAKRQRDLAAAERMRMVAQGQDAA